MCGGGSGGWGVGNEGVGAEVVGCGTDYKCVMASKVLTDSFSPRPSLEPLETAWNTL